MKDVFVTVVMKLSLKMTELVHRTPYWIVSGRVEKCSGQCVRRMRPPKKPKNPSLKASQGFSRV